MDVKFNGFTVIGDSDVSEQTYLWDILMWTVTSGGNSSMNLGDKWD